MFWYYFGNILNQIYFPRPGPVSVTCAGVPVKCWFALQNVWMHQLLKQTVHQYGQRGEADIIQRQIHAVIKSLREQESRRNHTLITPQKVSRLNQYSHTLSFLTRNTEGVTGF